MRRIDIDRVAELFCPVLDAFQIPYQPSSAVLALDAGIVDALGGCQEVTAFLLSYFPHFYVALERGQGVLNLDVWERESP